MSKAKTDTFASVWDAIADTARERANLRVRSDLMSKLAAIVEAKGWTQTEAATRCGLTQPRINDLLRGRLSRFSLDALVNIAAALGQRVHVELDAAARAGRVTRKPAASMRQSPRQGGAVRRNREVGARVAARGEAEKKKSTHAA
jgi:predicted XRE-type DNA-binding protein